MPYHNVSPYFQEVVVGRQEGRWWGRLWGMTAADGGGRGHRQGGRGSGGGQRVSSSSTIFFHYTLFQFSFIRFRVRFTLFPDEFVAGKG